MTLFGKKDDAGMDTPATAAGATANLSAPHRGEEFGSSKKSSRLPGILFILVGAVGGYFAIAQAMNMMPAVEIAPAPTDIAATEPALTAAPADAVVTPAVDAAATDPAATDLAAPPVTDVTADLAAPPNAIPSDAPVAAVAEPAAPAVAETVMTVPPVETASAPVAPAPAAAAPADLPVPATANTDAIKPVVPAENALPATGTAAPNPAEMAIMQNAAMLDQLSQPAPVTGAANAITDINAQMNGQDAIIRPMPKQYLIVKKNHDAEDVDSRLSAARRALAQNNNNGALQLFNDLYKDFPRDQRILMGRAVALQKMGQNEQALEAYESVLSVDPKNLEALTNMLGLLKAQDPALAVEKLIELQAAYPDSADIAAQLGIAQAGQGSYDQATKYLDIAEALKPGSAYVLYNKAVLYDKMGNVPKAAELYRQIIRMSADGRLDQQLPIESIQRRLGTLR